MKGPLGLLPTILLPIVIASGWPIAAAAGDLCTTSFEDAHPPTAHITPGESRGGSVNASSEREGRLYFDRWFLTAPALTPLEISVQGKHVLPRLQSRAFSGAAIGATQDESEAAVQFSLGDLDALAIEVVRDESIDSRNRRVVTRVIMPPSGQLQLIVRAPTPCSGLDYRISVSAAPAPKQRRGVFALLVGVPDARWSAAIAPLPSVHADLDNMRRFLRESGIPDDHIRVVGRDQQATRFEVVRAFREHLGQAASSGTTVLYFSGHGTNIDRNYMLRTAPDPEVDGRDEALILADGWLVDDELGQLIDGLKATNRLIILDSCSSGDATRDFGSDALIPKRVLFEDLIGGIPREQREVLAKSPSLATPGETTLTGSRATSLPYVVLTATTEHSPAYARSSTDRSSVFTESLITELRIVLRGQQAATFVDVMDAVRPAVARVTQGESQSQEPQVEGKLASRSVVEFLGLRR